MNLLCKLQVMDPIKRYFKVRIFRTRKRQFLLIDPILTGRPFRRGHQRIRLARPLCRTRPSGEGRGSHAVGGRRSTSACRWFSPSAWRKTHFALRPSVSRIAEDKASSATSEKFASERNTAQGPGFGWRWSNKSVFTIDYFSPWI